MSISRKREITSYFTPKSKRLCCSNENETPVDEINGHNGTVLLEERDAEVKNDDTTSIVQHYEEIITPMNNVPFFDLGTWSELLENEFSKSYFKNLMKFVDCEYARATVYPPREQIFTAFTTCQLDQLKVVIIGQDPYHGPNQAHGLAFSVLEGNTPPPSLRNIFKEAKVSELLFLLMYSSLMLEYLNQSMVTLLAGVVKEFFCLILS